MAEENPTQTNGRDDVATAATKPSAAARKTSATTQAMREALETLLAEDAASSDLIWLFAAVGTINDYFLIREKFDWRDFPAHLAMYDSWECTLIREQLEELGIPLTQFEAACGGDCAAIDDLCSFILRSMRDRDPTETAKIRRGLEPSDARFNFVVAAMNEGCAESQTLPPPSLVYLNSLRLMGMAPRVRENLDFHRFATDVGCAIEHLVRTSTPISATRVAKLVGVPTSTITRNWEKFFRVWESQGVGIGIGIQVDVDELKRTALGTD